MGETALLTQAVQKRGRLRLGARCPRELLLCLNRFHQPAIAQNAHYSFRVVGQDVQRHFGAYGCGRFRLEMR